MSCDILTFSTVFNQRLLGSVVFEKRLFTCGLAVASFSSYPRLTVVKEYEKLMVNC